MPYVPPKTSVPTGIALEVAVSKCAAMLECRRGRVSITAQPTGFQCLDLRDEFSALRSSDPDRAGRRGADMPKEEGLPGRSGYGLVRSRHVRPTLPAPPGMSNAGPTHGHGSPRVERTIGHLAAPSDGCGNPPVGLAGVILPRRRSYRTAWSTSEGFRRARSTQPSSAGGNSSPTRPNTLIGSRNHARQEAPTHNRYG